jgi:hypothetical protein
MWFYHLRGRFLRVEKGEMSVLEEGAEKLKQSE